MEKDLEQKHLYPQKANYQNLKRHLALYKFEQNTTMPKGSKHFPSIWNFTLKFILLKSLLLVLVLPVVGQEAKTAESIPYMEGVQQAKELIRTQQFDSALAIIQKTKSGLGAPGSSNYLAYASVNDLEGQTFYGLGELSKAVVAFEETLDFKRKLFGGEHYTLTVNYGNIGSLLMQMQRYHEALPYFIKMLEINEEIPYLPKFAKKNEAQANQKIGDYYSYVHQIDSALIYYKRAKAVIEKHLSDEPNKVSDIYSALSGIYLQGGEHSTAFQYARRSVEVLQGKTEYEPDLTLALNSLANCYKKIGDFERERLYLQQSVAIYRKYRGGQSYFLYRPYNALGINATAREEYEEAIKYYQLAISLFNQQAGPHRSDLITLKTNLAIAHSLAGNAERSNALNLEAIDLAEALPDSIKVDNNYTLAIHHNIGTHYMAKRQFRKAAASFELATEMVLRKYGPKHPWTAYILSSTGTNLSLLQQFEKAEEAYQSALSTFDYHRNKDFDNTPSLQTLITTLVGTGKLYRRWYLSDGGESKLRLALDYFREAQAAITHYARRFDPISKFELTKLARSAYVGRMQCELHLYEATDSLHYKQAAFASAEAIRSPLLYHALQRSEALNTSDVEPELLEREQELRMKMTYLEKQKYGELSGGKGTADSMLQFVTAQLLQYNAEYQSLEQELAEKYPKYYAARYGQQTISTQKVQQALLAPNQTLVEYLLTDSSIYIFLLQKEDYQIRVVPHQDEITSLVERMTRDGLYSYHSASVDQRSPQLEEESIINYTEAAVKLYQKLWAPIAEQVSERVIIIPDQALANLPFETLLAKDPPRYGKIPLYDFLLKHHSISYGNSATLLHQTLQNQKQSARLKPFLGVAPFSEAEAGIALKDEEDQSPLGIQRDSLGTLINSAKEVLEISQLFQGDTWLGSRGTKARFVEESSNYKILHLSTHGKANHRMGDFAYLAFQQEGASSGFLKLYAKDIYNLRLKADLVVLSACETGLGRLRQGEGVISLARAFTYAGARSIINTLWAVDDESTATLMIAFYQQLIQGVPKDIALQQAKLSYLRQLANKPEKLAPFYWAPSVLIGEVSPVGR